MSEKVDTGENLGLSRCYAAEVRKCIRSIESIYPSIAMYDEPRERLAYKVNTLIQGILGEDRRTRKCVHDLAKEFSDDTTADYESA